MNILSKRDFWSVACTQNNEIKWFDNIRAFEWMQWKLRCVLLYCFRMCCFHCILRKKHIFLAFFWRSRYFSSIKLSHVNTSPYFSTALNVQKRILFVVYSHQTSYFSSYEITRDLCSAHHIPETHGRDDIDLWVNRHHRRCVDPRQNPIRLNWNYRAWKSISQRLTPYLSFKVTSQHTPHFKR